MAAPNPQEDASTYTRLGKSGRWAQAAESRDSRHESAFGSTRRIVRRGQGQTDDRAGRAGAGDLDEACVQVDGQRPLEQSRRAGRPHGRVDRVSLNDSCAVPAGEVNGGAEEL